MGLGRTSGNSHRNAYCASILFLTSKGHSWRMSGDSRYSLPNYPYFTSPTFYRSPTWSYITSIINTNVAHISSIKFGAHNDMDMMEIGEPLCSLTETNKLSMCQIGNGALTIQEQRTHFAAWVFLKSPILLYVSMCLLFFSLLILIVLFQVAQM